MSDTKRLHFITDVDDLGAAYRCKRCGFACSTKVEMRDHRAGFLTPCLRARLKERLL